MSPRALYLGVDGGGTRCRARIRDETGALVGEGEAGPANARRGAAAAMAEVVAASRAALVGGGLPPDAIASLRAGVGLAGVSQTRAMAAVLAEAHPFARLSVTTDYAIACLGAHGGEDGGIVIVGTGSAAYGLAARREWRFGGWGFEVGDDGGGAPLGREAVRHALKAADGLAPRGALADAVLAAVGGDQDSAVDWVGRAAPADFGALAPLVFRHAAFDPQAARLAAEAAGHAAALVLRLADCGVARVALVGGMAGAIAGYMPRAVEGLIRPALADAADGAIMLARRDVP